MKKNRKKLTSPIVAAFYQADFYTKCKMAGVIDTSKSQIEQQQMVADVLDVSLRTAQRWLTNQAEPHPCAVQLLLNYIQSIPQQGAWVNWRLRGDELIAPNGEVYTPHELGRRWLIANELAILRSENIGLKRDTDVLKQRIQVLDTGEVAKTLRQIRSLSESAAQLFNIDVMQA